MPTFSVQFSFVAAFVRPFVRLAIGCHTGGSVEDG